MSKKRPFMGWQGKCQRAAFWVLISRKFKQGKALTGASWSRWRWLVRPNSPTSPTVTDKPTDRKTLATY